MATGSLITNDGKKVLLNRGYKSSPDYTVSSQFKVGISNQTPAISDTDLLNPIPINSTESVDDCEATTGWTASGTNTVSLNSSSFKEGSNALNMIKSDATSADINVSKTTTSLDFTSKDFWIWFYVSADAYNNAATTDAVTIRFGSASGDYYQYTRDKADLTTTAWNAIKFSSATADSTTGSPTITACDYTFFQFTTDDTADTLIAGDLIIDDIKLASSGDYLGSFEASYPTFDETNHEVEIRCKLATTDANGYDIDGFALFNTDSTNLMTDEDTFTAESKSSTDEFLFIVVNRIV
jgi:hypothetical protein